MGRLIQQARIMELIGNVPPVEREAACYEVIEGQAVAA